VHGFNAHGGHVPHYNYGNELSYRAGSFGLAGRTPTMDETVMRVIMTPIKGYAPQRE
jgi:hypothetical protein